MSSLRMPVRKYSDPLAALNVTTTQRGTPTHLSGYAHEFEGYFLLFEAVFKGRHVGLAPMSMEARAKWLAVNAPSLYDYLLSRANQAQD